MTHLDAVPLWAAIPAAALILLGSGLTLLGALIGWAYLTRGRSVLLTWVLHSISGWLIFTIWPDLTTCAYDCGTLT